MRSKSAVQQPLPEVKKEYSAPISLKQIESQIKITNGARELVNVALTEFICFITSDIIFEVRDQQRVAIKDQDIIESMSKLGFDHYIPCLEAMVRQMGQNQFDTSSNQMNKPQDQSHHPHGYEPLE